MNISVRITSNVLLEFPEFNKDIVGIISSYIRYPNLTKFIQDNILPERIRNIPDVIEIYVNLFLQEISKRQNNNSYLLENIIYESTLSSPILYGDPDDCIDVKKELRDAIDADNIECRIDT